MEPFKESLGVKPVREIAKSILAAHPSFPAEKFLRLVLPELPKHELKGRVKLIASALAECLPKKPRESFPILRKLTRSPKNPNGLSGFQAWPLTQFVEDQGLEELELSLATLSAITEAMSAEFAVRPFLLRYPKESLKIFAAWAKDPSHHVRRLASEGSRPRLPWGQRLPHFQKDPSHCIEILRTLRRDPEVYVRKSVANHLNDFSKDHPDWLVKELKAWQKEFPGDDHIQWIIRHACRSLIKAGHAGALELQGITGAKVKEPALALKPAKVRMGDKLSIEFSASAARNEDWLIDYAIHHQKSDGSLRPKVFKWARKTVKAGEKMKLTKLHKFVPITTRKYYSGKHEVEIFVNGQAVARTAFLLQLKSSSK